MENNKENACEKCWMHGVGGGHHHWMHIVIKVAIAVFVFWAGMQFGELKGMLRGSYGGYGYGRGMMGGYYGNDVNRVYGPNMMYGLVQQVAPKSTTATTTKK